jgi:hypothetical protein
MSYPGCFLHGPEENSGFAGWFENNDEDCGLAKFAVLPEKMRPKRLYVLPFYLYRRGSSHHSQGAEAVCRCCGLQSIGEDSVGKDGGSICWETHFGSLCTNNMV